MDVSVASTLTTILNTFQGIFEGGIARITPMALSIYGSLLLIDATWSVIKAMLQENANYLKLFVEKAIRYSIFLFIIKNYHSIILQLLNTFITIGLTAGGGQISQGEFKDPSSWILLGLRTLDPVLAVLRQMGSSMLDLSPSILFIILAYVFCIIAFFVIAIQVFVTFLEFYIVGTLSVVFMGCAVNKHTTFLAEKSIGAVLAFGIKLMTLGLILSAAIPAMQTITVPVTAKNVIDVSFNLFVCVAAIAFLCWNAPSLAAGLMAGSPSLSAGGIAGALAAGAAAGTAAAMGVMKVAGPMGTVAGAAARDLFGIGGNAAQVANMTGIADAGAAAASASGGSPAPVTPENLASSLASTSGTGGDDAGAPKSAVTAADISAAMNQEGGQGAGGAGSQGGPAPTSAPAAPSGGGEEGGGAAGPAASPEGGCSSAAGGAADISGDTAATAPPQEGGSVSPMAVAGKLALINQAIPPEAAPQGGVIASLPPQDND